MSLCSNFVAANFRSPQPPPAEPSERSAGAKRRRLVPFKVQDIPPEEILTNM